MSGVNAKRTLQLLALLQSAPRSYGDIGDVMKIQPQMVRRYFAALGVMGQQVRVADWRREGSGGLVRLFGIGTEPDVKRGEAAVLPDAEVEAMITRENVKKAAQIQPRRDPMIAMFYGAYVACP